MRATSQFTITSICDVITSDTPPDNPYFGQLWVNTAQVPPRTMVWDGSSWAEENDLESLRSEVSVNTDRISGFQSTADGLNSYVSSLTETIQTISDSQGVIEENLLNSEKKLSNLSQTVDGLTLTFEEQYMGGINYVKNSAGLNGITDDWEYSGTVSVDSSTDTQNNTVSDSAIVLGASSNLTQYIYSVVPGTYTITLKAKKTSSYSGYVKIIYNGNKSEDVFNQVPSFGWTEFSLTLNDVTDPTIKLFCYSRGSSLYLSDIMLTEGTIPRKWTPAPNEIYTSEVKIDRRGIEVSNSASSQKTVITNTEFAGYYNDEVIFTLNKDETLTKKTTVNGELTVGKTKFVPLEDSSQGLNIVILD